jgi:hypothetical protein
MRDVHQLKKIKLIYKKSNLYLTPQLKYVHIMNVQRMNTEAVSAIRLNLILVPGNSAHV